MEKFDRWDRNRVIDAIQDCCDVKLKKVRGRDKWRQDESGKNWWILGGKGNFHGIPEEMMKNELQTDIEGILVIAQKERERTNQEVYNLKIFRGPLNPFTKERSSLYRASNSTGDYQFTVKQRGDHMQCDQIPGMLLTRLTTIPYSVEARSGDRRVHDVSKQLAKLSPEEISELMGRLNKRPNGT